MTLRLSPSVPHPALAPHDVPHVLANASGDGIRVVGHGSTAPLQFAVAAEVGGGTGNTLDGVSVAGGLTVKGGARHTVTRCDASNHGAARGSCVYFASAGDPMTLAPSNHFISHTEIHDCRGLGNPRPSSAGNKCDPQEGVLPVPVARSRPKRRRDWGSCFSKVTGANVCNNFVHDTNDHAAMVGARLNAACNRTWPGSGPQAPSALSTTELNPIKDWN